VTDGQIEELLDRGKADFTPAERAAIAFGEEMTRRPQGVSDATFAELRKHWNERQVVEIAAVAALFNSFNRFNNALDVEPTVYPKSLS
jgi:alkylhydroperoxidase family enzyme